MSWWSIQPHGGVYGGRTVVGPAWPNVDEQVLEQAATTFERFRDHVRTTVIPDLQAQMMALADAWDGAGSEAARDEASAIIDEHEANALLASVIAQKLRAIEAAVVNAKNAANANAQLVQADCDTTNGLPGLTADEREALNDARVARGIEENIGVVSDGAAQLAADLGLPPGTPGADGKVAGHT
ncbi:PPE family protein [Mycolicibacterium vanbaalenii PYR-1]|uniref:PPE family protein n=2 Tax=Mycolicibacterium vanbaalenii TaxID=110539 RepID=A1T5Y0_MYCVP|nr:WXG100 family type VII secretion target [Mycolicibacterium vanbaalenii]ABM12580.1 PPE family protein [Mycolicibacterium vanbaalenii PYR-1]